MTELQGELLKIDEEVGDEGIFFVSENGGAEVKVSFLHQNYPKNLQFEVPENLNPGAYKLEIRNRARRGNNVRKGGLDFH